MMLKCSVLILQGLFPINVEVLIITSELGNVELFKA